MSGHTTRAVIIIQKHLRGYLARRRYSKMLLTLFEEEEEKEGRRHQLRSRIAERITLNDNEERLANVMAARIQRAWKKDKKGSVQAHPQLRGQDNSIVLDNCNKLSIEEQLMDEAHDTTSSYRSLARNMVELLDTEPITVPAPTNNVSADHPSYKGMLNSEYYSASTEPKLNKQKLNCMSIHPVEHSGFGLKSNSGTNHDIIPPPTTVKLLNKGFEVNSKEEVKSLDDQYHLCYSTELSDSSVDEDKNWQAGPKFPDTAIIATGDGLIIEDNTNCELDIFCDDQQQCVSHSVQADYECVSPSKWKVLDHSSSPLHAMTLQQLRQLFLSLEQQLSDHSRTLIEVLEEKDRLKNENELLKINIAHLARIAQSILK